MKFKQIIAYLFVLAGIFHNATLAAVTPDVILDSRRWEQLVIPADASSTTVRELFADDLPADGYGALWVIFLFDGQRGQYVNPGIDGAIPAGAGFWMFHLTESAVTLDLPSSVPETATQRSDACAVDECVVIPLSSQADQAVYTMLGSALATTVLTDEVRIRVNSAGSACQNGCSLQQAVEQQYISAPLWHYDTASNAYIDLSVLGQIEPWQAFWLLSMPLSTGTMEMLFPVASPGTGLSAERAEASRFLAQSTFGPTTADIDDLLETDYSSWIDRQVELPVTSMLESFDALQAANPASAPSRDWVFESFWTQAAEAEDQLRQRVAFALSQIFVISLREGAVASFPRGVADFYSVLLNSAFGNFRSLLEQVTLHPMMGAYLSHLGNEKGDPATRKVPDENFAREIMQLFTIGLQRLGADGRVVLTADGQPQETYTNSDVQGLARVFTGFSWNGPDTSIGRFQGWISVPDRDVLPMQAYPQFHSTLEKNFLGTRIAASSVSDPEGDLKIALDTLFNHPNVGPFIGKQLIQRLVTSNPSRQYISRVSAAFNDNGEGVRGDMRAVIRAILLDPEARDINQIDLSQAGRIREPILRLAHWMRSFDARPANGRYTLLGTDDPATSIGMTVLRSPSVFNFYRPGYVPPNTPIADADLVSPEMQITHETSIAGYLNSMLNTVELGTGSSNAIISSYNEAVALASDPQSLVDHVNLLLLHGSMSSRLQGWLTEAIQTIDLEGDLPLALLRRARLAVYLAMASPEYIVLK